jgi:MFS family permease
LLPNQEQTTLSRLEPLRTRKYAIFWIGNFLSNIGSWMQQVAEPWLVLSLSGSSALLGLDAFASDAPVWSLTVFGGLLADRWDRRKSILLFQSLQMLCPIALVGLIVTGRIRVWMIIGLSLIVGITDALSLPSLQSIVPTMVQQQQVESAIALSSTQFNLSRIVGPVAAGLIMARWGAVGCFGANAISYLPLLLVGIWLGQASKKAGPVATSQGADRPWFADLREIVQVQSLRGALSAVLVTSLFCGPLVTFFPVLIKQVFHSDVSHFGRILAGFGAGGLLGAIAVLATGGRWERWKFCSGLAISYGFILIAVGLSKSFALTVGLAIIAGLVLTASNTSANAILQNSANDRIRGQTASLYMLAMRGGLSLGNLTFGLTAAYLGVGHALMLNGVLAVLVQSWNYRLWAPPH